MAKWGYLARAYAIGEYAVYRANLIDNGEDSEEENDFYTVKSIIKDILVMAENNYVSRRETPYDYRLIKQCKKFLEDFS